MTNTTNCDDGHWDATGKGIECCRCGEPFRLPSTTPSLGAKFMELDRWLLARGWARDRGAWKSIHRNRVTIANYETAIKIQHRRDRHVP